MPRTRLDLDTRRAQLLDVGRRLFADHPYDAVSTAEITREAGISKGLLFHYFGSKRGFYLETLKSVADEILGRTAPAPELPFDQAVRRALWAYLEYARDHRALYAAMARGGIGSDPEGFAIVQKVRDVSVARMLARLDAPMDGRLRIRLAGWVGLVEHELFAWLEHGGCPLEELFAHQVQMLGEVIA